MDAILRQIGGLQAGAIAISNLIFSNLSDLQITIGGFVKFWVSEF